MNAAVADVIADAGRAARYALCVKMSKKAEWQIDRDLLRDRSFDFSRKFLPDGLSLVDQLEFLSADEARLLSQIQGRTYAYIFGLVERFIAPGLERGRAHVSTTNWPSKVSALLMEESNTRGCSIMETFAHMAPGYRQVADPNSGTRCSPQARGRCWR